MAKNQVTLEILLKSAGIKPTEAQLKKLNKTLQETAVQTGNAGNAANKYKRKADSMNNANVNATKGFAKQAQGLGGLVQVYATVAANVFAISSAFLVLRRAADLSSMIKSAENFSDRFGVSVTRITKQMQEASGGALSFAEALPTINKAVSAGIPIEKMEALTKAATKAAQTFGGTANEALNRFISASQRGRVEIIQTLGVVIKTEQAYADYASRIGKTAQELTAFDRQQAILNATIEESNRVFNGVEIDPNPFQILATTMIDLKDTISTFITDSLTPLVHIFNQSIPFALATFAAIISSIGKRAFPLFTGVLDKVQAKNVEVSKSAAAALANFKAKEANILLNSGKDLQLITKKQLLERSKLFDKFYAEQLAEAKVFQKQITLALDDPTNKFNINQRKAQINKELNARAAAGSGPIKGGIGALRDIGTKALQLELARLNEILRGTQKNVAALDASFLATSNAAVGLSTKLQGLSARAKVASASIKSIVFTSFLSTARNVNSGLDGMATAIKSVGTSWSNFAKGVKTGELVIVRSIKAVTKTIGLLGGGIGLVVKTLFNFLPTILFALPFLKDMADRFFGVSKATKEAIEKLKDLGETLKEVNERTDGFISRLKEGDNTLLGFVANLEFVRGTADSIGNSLNNFNEKLVAAFNGRSLDGVIERAEALDEALTRARGNVNRNIPEIEINAGDTAKFFRELESGKLTIETLGPEMENFVEIARVFADEVGPSMIDSFRSLDKLLTETSLGNLSESLFRDSIAGLRGLGEEGNALADALGKRDFEAFGTILEGLGDKAPIEAIKAYRVLEQVLGEVSGKAFEISQIGIQAGRTLEDLNKRLNNYVSGIDKLKGASLPGKELLGFVLDSKTALEGLQKVAKEAGEDGLGKIEEVLGSEGLELFRSFLQVPDDANLQDYIDAAASKTKILQDNVEAVLLASEQIKTVNLEIQLAKSKEIRSDTDRLAQIEKLRDLTIERLDLEISSLTKQIAFGEESLRQLEDNGQGQSFVAQQLRLQLETMRLQRDVAQQNQDQEKDSTKLAETRLDIEKQKIDAQERVLRLQKETAAIEASNIGGIKARAEFARDQFEIQRRINALAVQDLENQRQKLFEKKLEGDLLTRELAIIDAQIEKQRAINAEYERRQGLIVAAQSAEAAGVSIFSEEGLATAATFFVNKVNEEAGKLKTTFQILGEGFASTMFSTIDTSVQNLLEGGEDFAETVREGLKASLRDVFGEAISSRIKSGIAELFNIDTEANRAEKLTNLKLASETRLIHAINANTAARVKAGTGTGVQVGPTKAAAGQTGGNAVPVLKGIQTILGNGITTQAPGTEGAIGEGNKTAEAAAAIASQGNQSIIGTLLQLGSMLVSAIFSSGAGGGGGGMGGLITGIVGAFSGGGAAAAANGAVFKGGFQAFEYGGMVNKPTLGLIGEGKNNEAVVPLPNNREIPVDLRGGGDTINIEQNFDFTNADSNAIPTLRAEARAIEERTFNRVFNEINKGGRYAKMSGRRG